MLVLATKPLQKLTGTDRQADGQTCVLGGCASKNLFNAIFVSIANILTFKKRIEIASAWPFFRLLGLSTPGRFF